MTFIPAPNCAKVAISFVQDGQTLVNVFHFSQSGGFPDTTVLTDLADAVLANFSTHIAPEMCGGVVGLSVTAVDIATEGGAGVEIPNTITTNPDFPGMPTNVTITVKWVTGLTGRSNRGRTYFIGMKQANVLGNDISVAAGNSLEASWIAFFDSLVSAGYNMAVVSYFHNRVPRAIATSQPILGAVLPDFHLDSQRRRLTGRGN